MEVKSTNIEDARIGMHGRILRCPLGENPEDCPLHEVRKWPVKKRLSWLESKTDEEVLGLYNYHLNCLDRKFDEESD